MEDNSMRSVQRNIAALLCAGLMAVCFTARAADTPTYKKVAAAKSFQASKLTGLPVKNSQGEALGTVEDLVVDVETGKVAYMALSFGGVLGIGDKLFAVPFGQVKFMHGKDEMHFVLDVPKDKLKSAPGFDKNHWPDFADPKWMESIDAFYGEHVAKSTTVEQK
jgi:sporulation protein YlmC with PRC-barrel domain